MDREFKDLESKLSIVQVSIPASTPGTTPGETPILGTPPPEPGSPPQFEGIDKVMPIIKLFSFVFTVKLFRHFS